MTSCHYLPSTNVGIRAIELQTLTYPARLAFPIKLKYDLSRNYYLCAKKVDFNSESELFTNVLGKNKIFEFDTLELQKLNAKLNDALTEIMLISDEAVFDAIDLFKPQIGTLLKVCECLGTLDMLSSFAFVSSVNNFVRPKFGEVLAIQKGRHPIMGTSYEPNDAYASPSSEFQIVAGINMSGKCK